MCDYEIKLIEYFKSHPDYDYGKYVQDFVELLNKESTVSNDTLIHSIACMPEFNIVLIWYYTYSLDNGLRLITLKKGKGDTVWSSGETILHINPVHINNYNNEQYAKKFLKIFPQYTGEKHETRQT